LPSQLIDNDEPFPLCGDRKQNSKIMKALMTDDDGLMSIRLWGQKEEARKEFCQ
jgi:hypothetical protein